MSRVSRSRPNLDADRRWDLSEPEGVPGRLPEACRGRGALGNPPNRYAPQRVEPVRDEDNASILEDHLRTRYHRDRSRSVLAFNASPDLPFDQSLNPYRGCEHGCVYCFARPSHAWLGFSPGLDFETEILVKPDAAALLRKAWDHPRYRCRVLAMGTNTDPYQPAEERFRITRAILEAALDYRHPVALVTKSGRLLRDLDLFQDLAERRLVMVHVSITTLEPDLARRMEPRAASPRRRLRAMEALAGAGVPVGVMVAPVIPGLTDHELEAILQAARDAGAGWASYAVLRLPGEVKDLFVAWLRQAYPSRARRVLNRMRELHGGAVDDRGFSRRRLGQGPWADLLGQRFRSACGRLGLSLEAPRLDVSGFRRARQGNLFDPGG